jgi:hypothetical protein
MGEGDAESTGNDVARITFILTVVSAVLFVGAVVIFVL